MCGIVGLIDTVEDRIAPRLLESMRDAMIARGPDDAGAYYDAPIGMAMRRLAVIDVATGSQPFFSRGDQIVVFQNGEIYNYRELRLELDQHGYHFISHADTEVLAHGFAEWGIEGLLRRIDGMYAIAILDRQRRELHLARDRFGEKPLFYAHAKGRFAYSSSLLVLAALDWVSEEIDLQSLDRYLALHYVPGDATIFKAIKRVLPGEHLVVSIDDPQPRRYRYFTPALADGRESSDDDLAARIEAAVESRLIADVPVGIFLSGGLDSSVLAAVAAGKHPGIATFSMGFASPPHDESQHARLVADKIGSDHHHFTFDEESFRSLLPQVASALDEPVGDQAMLPLFWLCREARRHVTVALSGEGADEVFGGYSYYDNHLSRSSLIARLKSRFVSTEGLQQRLIDNAEPTTPSGFPLLSDTATRKRLTGNNGSEIDAWERNLFAWLNQSRDSLQRASAADIATWLPDDLLVKFDRMSMAHSLEGRAPYLDPKIVELGLRLPQSQRIDGSIGKVALRRVAERWLPKEILARPKQGFVLPMRQWLAQWFEAQRSVTDYFGERAIPGLDMAGVASLTETDLAGGVSRERLLFALVLLVEWYKSFTSRKQEAASLYEKSAAIVGH